MINYNPFWKTVKEKRLSQYALINTYNINRRLIHKLKHNLPISTLTLDDLCQILQVSVDKIIEITIDKTEA